MLNSYDKYTDPVFHALIVKIKDDHETGSKSYTYDQIMKYAVNKFNFMVQKGEWIPNKGSLDERLLVLESKTGLIPRKKKKRERKSHLPRRWKRIGWHYSSQRANTYSVNIYVEINNFFSLSTRYIQM